MKYVAIILVIIAIISLIYFLVTYNSLIKLNNKVKEAFSTMDVYLKKRWDLIPNIVETVKGYAKHEKETYEEIVNLRNNNYEDMSNEDKIKANQKINSSITKLMALAEAYPELKASDNFLSLSDDLNQIEDEIAQSRKYYNAVVRLYNNKVEMIPSNIVAKMFASNIVASITGYKTKLMFEARSEERENVKVDLS